VYLPGPHPDSSIEAIRPYIIEVVTGLVGHGIRIVDSWLDPMGPRDATIRFLLYSDGPNSSQSALVWDEETGWRRGLFVDGQPGTHTILSDATQIGGGLLPPGQEVAGRVIRKATASPQKLRSFWHTADGFDDALQEVGRKSPHSRLIPT
jgi:hypothetical protein